MQFPSGNFRGATDALLINLNTHPLNIKPEVPAPYVERASMDPLVDNTNPLPTVQVDASPPVVLPQVTVRDLLLGMKALRRRINDLQVLNKHVQAWHVQMSEQVLALEQDWERKSPSLR